jgi:protein required for attachment to host cells
MNKLNIPHVAFVFVGDGRKALFLRNAGDEKFPNFRTERVCVDDNPRRAAIVPAELSRALVRTSAAELKRPIEQHRFAQRVAAAMERLVRERNAEGAGRGCAAADARRFATRFPRGREEADHRRSR